MLAFVFPGQGSQLVGMGADLCRDFAVARETFHQADEALGFELGKLCREGPESMLQQTANSQPAILTMSIAALRVLQSETGLHPALVAGHSLGEYSALVCAQALGFEDAVRTVRKRGQFMQEAVPAGEGGMAAVMGIDAAAVDAVCAAAAGDQVLAAANRNAPNQTVIAGHAAAVQRATQLAEERGAVVKPLRVSAPFHCSLMQPAAERLRALLESLSFAPPAVPVIANVDARPYSPAVRPDQRLVAQVTACVRWNETVEQLLHLGVRQFVEVGPGKALSSMLRRADQPALAAARCGSSSDVRSLAERAQGDLASFVRPLGHWRSTESGDWLAADRSEVLWSDGSLETIDHERWRAGKNDVKIRRWGGMKLISPERGLEVLNSEAWEERFDGAFVRRDRSSVIHVDGVREDFDLAEWDLLRSGGMKRKDGTRLITAEGIEWDFNRPQHYGF
jgi:malonyl CoA-acyl carrier protein transacylase